jgi:hypothetical protein
MIKRKILGPTGTMFALAHKNINALLILIV